MILADVFTVLFVILGFWLTYPACCLLARALAPERVKRARETLARAPRRSLARGLALWLPAILAIAVAGKGPGPFKLVALVLAVSMLGYSFLGIAALAEHVGRGLPSPGDSDRPWMATIRGMLCLEIPATVPFLGWFVLAPAVFLLGAGAAWSGAAPRSAPSPETADAPAATEGAPA